ncbi:ribonuclease E inhibitor RraB [Chitinophaga sp. GCM10012297]|uniref:Tetratricopeptide repeat protein n=1 Tax=Chitinophaga chungangae TaxID=2821488 RepID=A0ABS3YFT8_9BACT|nr:tetratricopeptide repeat protein [Chitinophaga chungangae]MBO9153547.1 tetratricopeptide repeat protein [Chitinophaga chungangae]
MAGRYFTREEFITRFPGEAALAGDVYARMTANGFTAYALAEFDVYFVSDSREKLEKLAAFLTAVYGMQTKSPAEQNGQWELETASPKFPVDADNLLCWAIDLAIKGYEHDCRLDGYGTFAGADNKDFQDESAGQLAHYFELAMESYRQRNFGAAVINFTTAIRIFPENPNSWYSRAIAKEEILLGPKAREDYDKAIALSPEFREAYINRAVNKDEAGEYEAALADFNKAIELNALDPVVYFNRGNTRRHLGDQAGACSDWKKAKDLGGEYAAAKLEEFCK